jgi:hypothetical protein
MSKPDRPGVIRASIAVVALFGQGGRERRGNMCFALDQAGALPWLSVTDRCRDSGGDGAACSLSKLRRCSVLLTLEKLMWSLDVPVHCFH